MNNDNSKRMSVTKQVRGGGNDNSKRMTVTEQVRGIMIIVNWAEIH